MKFRCDRFVCNTLALTLLASAPLLAQQSGEEWEYQGSMNMMGMSMPIPATKRCQLPEQNKTPPMDSTCQVSDIQTQGDTTTFKVRCSDPEPMEGSGTTTLTSDHLDSSYTLKLAEGEMTFSVTGKKLGACTTP